MASTSSTNFEEKQFLDLEKVSVPTSEMGSFERQIVLDLNSDSSKGENSLVDQLEPSNSEHVADADLNDLQCSSVRELLAFNEAYREVIDGAIGRVEEALHENRRKQEHLREQKRMLKANEVTRKKVPVVQYLPPYFKDDKGMCPPMSNEARSKLEQKWFDPLMKEEKKWTPQELKTLREAVKDSMITIQVEQLVAKRDLLVTKLKETSTTTTGAERRQMTTDLEDACRRIMFYRQQKEEDVLLPNSDFSKIRWSEISTQYFKNTRSDHALRAKWMNEQSPRWSKDSWTSEEVEKLRRLRESPSFVSWPLLAIMLGTRRTAFQCFEKYKCEIVQLTKEWTQEEDQKLIALTNMLSINGSVQWDKVAQFMPGRTRQQVRTRFSHTLDSQVKHGRWTDQEDLLLMCSVSRLGAKDWSKVAMAVPGRNDSQCRERWVNVLNKPSSQTEKYTLEEDEKLLYAVQIFGKGNWAQCTTVLPNRSCRQLRRRYIQLISAKLKLLTGQCTALEAIGSSRTTEDEVQTRKDVLPEQLLRVYNRFSRMGDDRDGSAESLIKRVNEIGNNSTTAQRYAKYKRSVDWPVIEANLKEISEKHKSGEPISANELLQQLEISNDDVRYMVERYVRESTLARARRSTRKKPVMESTVDKSGLRVRPIPHTEDSNIQTEFDDDVPEEERRMCLVEALCSAVRKHDNYEWDKQLPKYRNKAIAEAKTFIEEIMNETAREVVECKKNGTFAPPKSTLAPTFATCSLDNVLEQSRTGLNQLASKYFYPAHISLKEQEGFTTKSRLELTSKDRLNITLSPEITNSPEYMLFTARLRAMLLEPKRLQIAKETIDEEHRRMTTSLQLEERQIEEECLRNASIEHVYSAPVADEESEAALEKLRKEGIIVHTNGLIDESLQKEREKRVKQNKIHEVINDVIAKNSGISKKRTRQGVVKHEGHEEETETKHEVPKKKKKECEGGSRKATAREAKLRAETRLKTPEPNAAEEDQRSTDEDSDSE